MGCNGFSLYAAVHRQKGENDKQSVRFAQKVSFDSFLFKEKNERPRVHDAAPFGIYMEHIGIGSVLGLEG